MVRTKLAATSLFIATLLISSCNNPDNATLPAPVTFIEEADCFGQCQRETECLTGAAQADIDEYCEELCRLGRKALVCQYEEFSDYCKDTYKAYHDCYYSLDTCDEFKVHAAKMMYYDNTDDSLDSKNVCTEEIQKLWASCYTGAEMVSVDDSCGDDIEDYVDYRSETVLEPAEDAGVDEDTEE